MATNYVFSDNTDFSAKYVTRPGQGGYGGIITFSPTRSDGTTEGAIKEVDRALLCNDAAVTFGRTVSPMYFLNVGGTSYQVGRGNGTLQISGLLGSATDFGAMFGNDYANPCKKIFTVKLDAFGMMPCTGDTDTNYGTLIMLGVIADSVSIRATVQDGTGALYYSASANFIIAGLGIDSGLQDNAKAANILNAR